MPSALHFSTPFRRITAFAIACLAVVAVAPALARADETGAPLVPKSTSLGAEFCDTLHEILADNQLEDLSKLKKLLHATAGLPLTCERPPPWILARMGSNVYNFEDCKIQARNRGKDPATRIAVMEAEGALRTQIGELDEKAVGCSGTGTSAAGPEQEAENRDSRDEADRDLTLTATMTSQLIERFNSEMPLVGRHASKGADDDEALHPDRDAGPRPAIAPENALVATPAAPAPQDAVPAYSADSPRRF